MANIQPTDPHARHGLVRRFITLMACAVGVAVLTGCAQTDATTAAAAPAAPTVIEHTYCIESGELVERALLADGGTSYRPTGALVGSALSTGSRTRC